MQQGNVLLAPLACSHGISVAALHETAEGYYNIRVKVRTTRKFPMACRNEHEADAIWS